MNNQRRMKLKKIINSLYDIIGFIEGVASEEEDYMNNMPENLQGSDKYSRAEEVCEYLEDAIVDIESAIENINEARV